MMTTDELIAKYNRERASLNQKELAELEREIYERGTLEGVRKKNEVRHVFLHRVLGESLYELSNRYALLAIESDRLWDRVLNDKMPVRTAIELHRLAKETAYKKRIEVEDVLKTVLKDYDKGEVNALPNGKFIRKKRGGRKAPSINEESEVVAKSPRDTWSVIRATFEQMIRERMRECDPSLADEVIRDVMVDLNTIFTSAQSKITRLIAQANGVKVAVPLNVVNESLLTLHHDPIGRLGDPVDKALIKKNFRALVKKFHPDQNGGNESLRANYDAVISANTVIDQYVTNYGGKQDGRRHDNQHAS